MELRDIEIFLTLADELHFGRTAERLHITPSRVSHVIKKQERRLGVQLFERTSRTVRLTPPGQRLRDELLPAHRRILQALDRTAAEGRTEAGELRVGYSGPWCAELLLRAAQELRGRHPGWSVRIQEIQFNDLYGPLHRGELQLQITEFPVFEPGLAAGPVLLQERRALMLPADHPMADADTVSLEDLAEVPLLRLQGDHPKPQMDFHFPPTTPMGRPIPRGPSYTSWYEIPVLVAAGFGASIVAARIADYHARPGVAFVPFRDGPTLDYGVLLPAAAPAPLVPAFVELLRSLAEGDGSR
ncbi:LysR family transcriptional regulator [Streptomyces sp. NBC_00006]|uniref:LysR family transcriptional regulator n=1 Tax=unclassified Streptomyces TaxID=2593676 RepID=UPI00224EA874|nr:MULTISPECIES: LysR family transcriptional regulator [unclassified Streptomyces]MCX4834049.1 LysR family transcriptional regulator [Streptomyces sp. NBC_01016]MCX5535029.1 LysR family transcriptional regulator [Streptomyces sp. NBC_00006]